MFSSTSHAACGWAFAIALIGAAATEATAQPDAQPVKPHKALMVLTPAEVDARRLIPAPPSEDGEAQKAELADLHRIIAVQTPQRLTQAKWDDDHEDPSMYYATIGGGFDLKTLPATSALLAVVMNDQGVAASMAKKIFPRKRPWVSDPTIKTCDPGDKPLTSYPSGHATMAFSVGTVLATLMPQKAEAIEARAQDYAFSREICGSHYASDTEASHVLGAVIAIELLTNPTLQPKIAAAEEELRSAGFAAR